MVLKSREKIMVALAAAVVLYFAVDFLVLGPMQKGIKVKRAQLKELEEKMTASTGIIPELSALRTRVEEKKRFLDSAKEKVVGKDQLRVFLDQLAAESARLKLEINSLTIGREGEMGKSEKPAAPQPAGSKAAGPEGAKFKKIMTDLNLSGSYEGVLIYLAEVEKLPLFMEMDQVQIQGNKEGVPKVQLLIRPGFLMMAEEKL
jgi:Tfp pilus assembly protein PilO